MDLTTVSPQMPRRCSYRRVTRELGEELRGIVY